MVALVRCGRQPDLHVEPTIGPSARLGMPLRPGWQPVRLRTRPVHRRIGGQGTLVGQQAIGGVLDRAAALLPYGPGTSVRHVVGTAQGGAYEWKNPGAVVPNGIIALQLDTQARISGLTTTWDGSLVCDQALTTTLQTTIEH
jgi:hypothetical protein